MSSPRPIDYRARRERCLAELGEHALLAMAQPTAQRNSTVEHNYRQESFMHWLTGFEEPEAALLVLPHKPVGERFVLFLRQRDPERETWDGRRLGVERAKERLGIDQAYPFSALWEKLPELVGTAKGIYFNLGLDEGWDRNFIRFLGQHKARFGKKTSGAKLPVHDIALISGRLRLRKDAAEVDRMRAAAAITRAAHMRAMKETRPGLSERDVHGVLLGEFLRGGAEMEAYGAIVAGGDNACILHYRENNAPLKDGDLLLIDAGSQFDYYASDVTRTFPVGKRFSPEQKAVYEVVLAAQKACIAAAVPKSSLEAVHDTAIRTLTEGLLSLGVLKGARDELIQNRAFFKYYPHGTSHWIGMDVHDVGVYYTDGKPLPLEAGMYFSVEPGLYFDPADESIPQAFRGIGVRIEDDVLVTDSGNDVITAGIPKEVADLENRN
jgi:Xaa-Pro aminopeptidase